MNSASGRGGPLCGFENVKICPVFVELCMVWATVHCLYTVVGGETYCILYRPQGSRQACKLLYTLVLLSDEA